MSLKVTTFSSKGRVTRISSFKCKDNIVHLQSDNQLRVFLILEMSEDVKEIKVNVELENLEKTLTEIDNLKLYRFRNKETGKLFRLHTNFLVTVKLDSGVDELIGISVKSTSELERKTVIEKLEIERRYWKAKGVRFVIITDKEIDKKLADNIMWIRETLTDKSVTDKEELSERLYYMLQDCQSENVSDVLFKFDNEEKVKSGTGLFLFRYLIADKQIVVDIKRNINLKEKVKNLIKF